MDTRIIDVLSQIGVPTGAGLVAFGLVRGAKSLEKDANKEALKYVSNLLKTGNLSNLGEVTAATVPIIFQRVFGTRPISFRFISRSIAATTLLWMSLFIIKPPTLSYFIDDVKRNWEGYLLGIPLFYVIDWASLFKSRIIINIVYRRTDIATTVIFLIIDILLSFMMPVFIAGIGFLVFILIVDIISMNFPIATQEKVVSSSLLDYFHDNMATEYFTHSPILFVSSIFVPSTLLTSFWTALLLVSNFVALLVQPIERLRRLTLWWFRDVEKRPLTAISKVAAAIIVAASLVISAARQL